MRLLNGAIPPQAWTPQGGQEDYDSCNLGTNGRVSYEAAKKSHDFPPTQTEYHEKRDKLLPSQISAVEGYAEESEDGREFHYSVSTLKGFSGAAILNSSAELIGTFSLAHQVLKL